MSHSTWVFLLLPKKRFHYYYFIYNQSVHEFRFYLPVLTTTENVGKRFMLIVTKDYPEFLFIKVYKIIKQPTLLVKLRVY